MSIFRDIKDFVFDIFGVLDDANDFLDWARDKANDLARYSKALTRYERDFKDLANNLKTESDLKQLAKMIRKVSDIQYGIQEDLVDLIQESSKVVPKLKKTGVSEIEYVKKSVLEVQATAKKLLAKHKESLDQLDQLEKWSKDGRVLKAIGIGGAAVATGLVALGPGLIQAYVAHKDQGGSNPFNIWKTIKDQLVDRIDVIVDNVDSWTRSWGSAKIGIAKRIDQAETMISILERGGVKNVRAVYPVKGDDPEKVMAGLDTYIGWLTDVQYWAKKGGQGSPPSSRVLSSYNIKLPRDPRLG